MVDSTVFPAYLHNMRTSLLQRPFRYRFYNATVALIAINVAFFILTSLSGMVFTYLSLIPVLVMHEGFVWQPLTYMFVHGGMWHILLNMLALFLFGLPVERRLGSHEFLLYYFVCGLGAGLSTLVVNWYLAPGLAGIPVVGASGAIYGLLLAYAVLFPDSVIFIFGILPLRAALAVALFAGIEIFSQLFNLQSGVAHLTHLAGLLFGYAHLRFRMRMRPMDALFRRR